MSKIKRIGMSVWAIGIYGGGIYLAVSLAWVGLKSMGVM